MSKVVAVIGLFIGMYYLGFFGLDGSLQRTFAQAANQNIVASIPELDIPDVVGMVNEERARREERQRYTLDYSRTVDGYTPVTDSGYVAVNTIYTQTNEDYVPASYDYQYVPEYIN